MKIKKTEVTNSSIPIPNGFKKTDFGLIPEDWEEIDFESTLSENDFSRDNLIPSSEFENEGKYPIIDQGQEFIAGYTDLKEKVYKIKEPVVLFGDHTRIFKYIDFPFVGGADGIKIFSPDTKQFDSKFYYYVLSHLTIPSRGYNRHYKLLKEQKVIRPSLPEQKKIAHVLSKIQQAIETQEQIIKTTQELKKALMQKLFTEGLNGEPQKQTEIGPIPESWDVGKLGEIIEATLYGLSIKGKQEGKYPALRMTNQYDGKTILENLQYVDLDIEKFEKFKLNKEDILFNRTNSIDLVGKTSIFESDIEAVFFSYLIRIKTKRNILNPFYLNYFLNLQSTQRNLKKLATRGVSQSNISATRLKTFLIPFPSIERQIEIVAMIKVFDHKIDLEKDRLKNMRQLLSNMLNQLMTGQIRVKDIEFKLEETAEAVEGV